MRAPPRFAGSPNVQDDMSTDLEQMLRRVLVAFNEHDLDEDDDHVACGDSGVSEWTISGTTVDREHIDVRGCGLWAFDADGKIGCKDSFWKIRESP